MSSSDPQIPVGAPGAGGDEVFYDSPSKGLFDQGGKITALEAQVAALQAEMLLRTRWMGEWQAGTYEARDQVGDGEWLMIANKQTTDRPAPLPSGNVEWVSETYGTLNFSYPTQVEDVWFTGQEYTAPEHAHIHSYRFYAPDNSGDYEYEVWLKIGGGRMQQLIAAYVPINVGWQEIPYSKIVPEGTVIRLFLITSVTVQPNLFVANWDVNNKNGNPGSGEANFLNNASQIRVHHTDDDGIDQRTNLEAIPAGAEFSFAGSNWIVTSVTLSGSHVEYDVSPNQGRPPEGVYALSWYWGAAEPIPYANHADFYSGAVGSILGFSGGDLDNLTYDQDAYGIDILTDDYIVSPDWDIQAYTSFD